MENVVKYKNIVDVHFIPRNLLNYNNYYDQQITVEPLNTIGMIIRSFWKYSLHTKSTFGTPESVLIIFTVLVCYLVLLVLLCPNS